MEEKNFILAPEGCAKSLVKITCLGKHNEEITMKLDEGSGDISFDTWKPSKFYCTICGKHHQWGLSAKYLEYLYCPDCDNTFDVVNGEMPFCENKGNLSSISKFVYSELSKAIKG